MKCCGYARERLRTNTMYYIITWSSTLASLYQSCGVVLALQQGDSLPEYSGHIQPCTSVIGHARIDQTLQCRTSMISQNWSFLMKMVHVICLLKMVYQHRCVRVIIYNLFYCILLNSSFTLCTENWFNGSWSSSEWCIQGVWGEYKDNIFSVVWVSEEALFGWLGKEIIHVSMLQTFWLHSLIVTYSSWINPAMQAYSPPKMIRLQGRSQDFYEGSAQM